ncbi:MAG TPA: chorismate mutase [Geminicoccaceae bacterium]
MDYASTHPSDLDGLRREVDRIDAGLVDLLGERLRVVAGIAAVKRRTAAGDGGGGLALRPAREAAILRRLVARADGRFPKATLVRMWRELLGATTQAQSPFAVCVHVPAHQPELWDVARDHFGSGTPLRRADSPGHALRQLASGSVQIAVLPLPAETDRWWPGLMNGPPAAGARVVARLPFADVAAYPDDVGGLAIATLPQEACGDDVTLVAIEADGTLSRGRLRELLAPLEPRWLACHDDGAAAVVRHLVELAGFLDVGDSRLGSALAPVRDRLLRVVPLGCYPRPLTTAELA